MKKYRKNTPAYTKLRLVLLVFLGFCTPLSMWAQEATGLIEEDSIYETQPILPDYDGSKALDLPAKVSLKNYCPIAGNQGQVQSCVGWSIGYAAYTIERAVQNRWTDAKAISAEASSAMYIYNNIKEGTDCKTAQASMAKAMTWLTTNGNCLAKEFDSRLDDCAKKPTGEVVKSAKKFVLAHHTRLFSINTDAQTKINAIRSVLAQNKPVVISFMINDGFKSSHNKEHWSPRPNDLDRGGHALTVVGYDDVTSQFLLFNSWGIGWGQNGFIKVKYADLAAKCRYAYTIFLDKPRFKSLTFNEKIKETIKETTSETTSETIAEPTTEEVGEPTPSVSEYDLVEMGGQLEINQFKGQSPSGELLFEPAEVDFMSNHYALRKNDWQVGQIFQLALTSQFAGAYIYVLSLNPKNEVKVLFPRDEVYNKRFAGKHESPLIMFEGARVVLPSPQSGMKVEFAGTDRICILFSLKKINNLPKLCELLKGSGDGFISKLHTLLGSHMIPLSETHFEDEKIIFSTATRSGAAIMPIIIECRAQ
jgi:Papain family cysteine protease